MNDCDNVNPIRSNAVDYSVGMLKDFTQLANLKFGNDTSRQRKGFNLTRLAGKSLDHRPRVIDGGLGDVIMYRLKVTVSKVGPNYFKTARTLCEPLQLQ